MSWTSRNRESFYSEFNDLINRRASETDAALNEVTGRKFQASKTAQLWGKVIPYTYGKRRITGQPLQAGIMRQKTTPGYTTEALGGGNIILRGYAQTNRTATFAYVFGAPGNPTSIQLLQRLWLNGTKIYDAATGERQSGLNFGFFTGSETQLPDATLNQQRYDFPVAYRGLMYVVFYDYVLPAGDPNIQFATNSGAFNPSIEAEFWEQTTNPIVDIPYEDNGAGSLFGIGIGFDARRGILYSIDDEDTIWAFKVDTGEYVSRVTATGMDGTQYSTIYAHNSAFFIEAGVPYFVVQGANSNSQRVYQINADTGVVTSAVGVDSGGLTPGPSNIMAFSTAKAVRIGGRFEIYAHSIFGDLFKFSTSGGQLTLVSFSEDTVDESTASGPVYIRDLGWKIISDNFIYNEDGTVYYTGTYDIKAVFQTGAFEDLIIFENSSGGAFRIYRIEQDLTTIVWEYNDVDDPTLDFFANTPQNWRDLSNTQGQTIVWQTSTTVYKLDMLAGTIEVIPTRTLVPMDSLIYDDYNRSTIQSQGAALSSHPIFNGETNNITLESLLRDLARRQGYAAIDVTVSGITDTIVGAAITQITDISTLLEDIALAYNFQIVKRGKKILFTRRVFGGAFSPDGLIVEADRVIMSEDDGAFTTVKSSRIEASQAPGTVVINFIDPDLKYIVNTVEHTRNDSAANLSQKLTLNLPIIFTASEAATLAARVVVNSNEGRLQHEFLLPQKFSRVEPGDYYELELPEYTDVIKLTEISFNADHSISCKAEAASTQIGPAIVMNDYVIVDDSPSLFDQFAPLVIDSPLLDYLDESQNEALEIYVGLVPAARSPVGIGSIGRSLTAGDFQPIGTTATAMLLGRLITALNDSAPWVYHEFDTITVIFSQGDTSLLVTELYEDVLSGANRLLIGRQGRWEFVGYTGVTYDSVTRTAVFTGLVRGLRGTDPNVGNHQIGDTVIFYQIESILLDDQVAGTLLDEELFYAGLNAFGQFNYEDLEIVTADGNARKPWAVQNLRADLASGDITITWTRRTRLLGPLVDGTGDVPLDETTEVYELDIYLGGSIVRAVTGVTSETFVYTAAQQTADGQPNPMLTIRLDVYQISSLVGRGFVKAGTHDVE